jgi:hypothetical protein
MRRRPTNSIFFRDSMRMAVKAVSGLLGCAFMLFVTTIAQAQDVSVLMYHNDIERTGWNQSETILTPANVTPSTFGLLVSVPLDAQVDAQPLVKQGLLANGHTTVYVVTENNTVYAIDGSIGNIVAQNNLGTPFTHTKCSLETYKNGILSTPTLDGGRGKLYVIDLTQIGGKPTYQLHALDMQTLQDTAGSPVTINPSAILEDGSTYNFNPNVTLQRPALLEVNQNIYAAFGSCFDGPKQFARGWLMGWNADTLALLGENLLTNSLVLTQSPISYLTSIWMSGYGLATDATGTIYFATGNSNKSYNTYTGITNIQESVIRASPDATSVIDLFTPSNVFRLDQKDKDLGAGGVLVLEHLPNTTAHLVLAAGKDGRLFIMNRDDLGGFHNPDIPAHVNIGACWCGESYYQGSDGVGRVVTSGGTKLSGGNSQSKVQTWTVNPNNIPALTHEATSQLLELTPQEPGFFTSISSNGTQANTQIIWAIGRPAGADNHVTLWAFDGTAQSGTLPVLWSGPAGFWNSTQHNANLVPTISNGMVYVASDKQLAIFGLLSGNQVRNKAALQPAPPPAPLVKVSGALMWGTIDSIHGSYIELTLRTGKLLKVDLTNALRQGNAQAPLIGRNVAVNGDFNAQGVLEARTVWGVKGSLSWGADRQG